MENDIHIGSIIKKKVEESKMSIAEFAEKIYCDRTTVYDLFKRKSIDIEKLIRISETLKYDFIKEIYQHKDSSSKAEEKQYFLAIPITPKQLKELALPEGVTLLVKEQA